MLNVCIVKIITPIDRNMDNQDQDDEEVKEMVVILLSLLLISILKQQEKKSLPYHNLGLTGANYTYKILKGNLRPMCRYVLNSGFHFLVSVQ